MLMDSKKIDELLNKYWNCESSLEEEAELREYFKGKSFPEQHKETAALFHYFNENKKKTLNDISFDGRVMAQVKTPARGKMVKLAYNTMRIAAGVAVLVVSGWLIRNEIRKSTPQE